MLALGGRPSGASSGFQMLFWEPQFSHGEPQQGTQPHFWQLRSLVMEAWPSRLALQDLSSRYDWNLKLAPLLTPFDIVYVQESDIHGAGA